MDLMKKMTFRHKVPLCASNMQRASPKRIVLVSAGI